MVASINHIHVVLSYDQQVPTKVLESVQFLCEKMEKQDRSDSGLAAVFMGIAQGKTIVKLANSVATQSQKESSHLDEFLKSLRELETFADNLPKSTSDEFDWKRAIELGTTFFKQLVDIPNKNVSAATKTIISNGKKTLSEFVSSICKAFMIGPVPNWFVSTVGQFKVRQSASPLPNVCMNDWVIMTTSKSISSDAMKICMYTTSVHALMKEIHECISSTQSTVLVKLSESLEKFKDTWQNLMDLNMITLESNSSMNHLIQIVKSLSENRVDSDVTSTTFQLADVMAKALLGDVKYLAFQTLLKYCRWKNPAPPTMPENHFSAP